MTIFGEKKFSVAVFDDVLWYIGNGVPTKNGLKVFESLYCLKSQFSQ